MENTAGLKAILMALTIYMSGDKPSQELLAEALNTVADLM